MDRATAHEEDDRTRKVPVIAEALEVDRVAVDRGGYRLTKQVSSREEVVDEIVHTHLAEIERRPIGRELALDEVPATRYEGDTLIVPVIEEVAVTQKKLFLIEEVRITPKQSTKREPRTYTLRKEEIRIERLGAGSSAAGVSEALPGQSRASTAPPGPKEQR